MSGNYWRFFDMKKLTLVASSIILAACSRSPYKDPVPVIENWNRDVPVITLQQVNSFKAVDVNNVDRVLSVENSMITLDGKTSPVDSRLSLQNGGMEINAQENWKLHVLPKKCENGGQELKLNDTEMFCTSVLN